MTASDPTVTSDPAKERWSASTVIGLLLVIGFIGMRLWRLTDFSLDGDEIFSAELARRNWHDLWTGAVQDAIHPPLFYLFLKLWVGIWGESLLSLRLFPVIVAVLSLIPVFGLCRELGVSPAARNLAIGIAAVHPLPLYYEQHVRMYCLLGLIGLFSTWCFVRYLRRPSNWLLLLLTTVNIAVVLTHYYGWFIVGLEGLFVLLTRRKLAAPVLSSLLVTAIAFSPWAWLAGQTLHSRGLADNLGWIPKPTHQDLEWFFTDLTGFAEFPQIGRWGAFAAAIVIAGMFWRKRDSRLAFLLLICIVPAPIAFLVSHGLSQSIWGHRHLVFTSWPFLIVFAASIWRLPWLPRRALVILVGIWAGFAVAFHRTDNRKMPYDALTLALLEHEHSTAGRFSVYAVDPYLHYPLGYFRDCLKTGRLGLFGPRLDGKDIVQLTDRAARMDIVKSDTLDTAHGRVFWVGYTQLWKQPETPEQILERRGCRVDDRIHVEDRFGSATLSRVECRDLN